MIASLIFVLIISCHCSSVESLNILGIFPYEGRSHFFVFKNYLQKLAEKGHNLTVISHFPREEVILNYVDVSLVGTTKIAESIVSAERSHSVILNTMNYVIASGNNNCKILLENESVQAMWKSKRKFDLVIMEQFNSDCGLGLAYKLGAPVIVLKTSDFHPWQYRSFGIPFNPSYSPFIYTGGKKPTLCERVQRTIYHYLYLFKFMNGQKVDQNTLEKYFEDLPPLYQLSRNVAFLLVNHNFVLTGMKLSQPNIIEVGGYHVMPPKPLPTALQKFIDESKDGVIYISFGTMLNESSLPEHKTKTIIDSVTELPQRIIWKWNGKQFPATKNIYASKWLPQNNLLAHPKVLTFFSHGGHLSVIEAVTHGVPMIAMPVFGDQPVNADNVEEAGFGVQISFDDLTKDNLLNKFKTVLDSKFRAKVKRLSKAYRARPVSAMDSAIFWTEFAAQHPLPARHTAADVPLYQYLCLDVLAVIGALAFLCLLVSVKLIQIMYFLTRKTRNFNLNDKMK